MCGGERRAERLLCNEAGECQQWGALSLEAGQLPVFSVLFQRVLGNCFLLSNVTHLLRMETVASGFKSQPLPSTAGVRP